MSSPSQSGALQLEQAPLEILDLRHFSSDSLRPVLEAENRLWAARLQWDYTASTNLLLQYLDSRVLPGFVALENGRVLGYTFCVYEDRKAVIGDVFALSSSPSGRTANEIEAVLLEHLLALLQNSPGVERIESQLLLHQHGAHQSIFERARFSIHRRIFMDLALEGRTWPELAQRQAHASALGYTLRPWMENDFHPAASLIAQAYEGHLDATINDQYRSVGGSLRFLHNIIRFPGCGVFDAAASHVLVTRGSGTLTGLVLCSRVHEQVEHVTQLCVAARARNAGLGATLLKTAAASLAARGIRQLSLTVTGGNQRAAALYHRLGFADRHSFDAMVWRGLSQTAGRLTNTAANGFHLQGSTIALSRS